MSSSEDNDLNPPCEYRDNLNVLRQTYFFAGLPLEVLKVFAYLCSREKFKAGEPLFRQGEDDGNALCIIAGSARIERHASETVHAVRIVGPGQFIGGLTLLGPTPRLYSLTALVDSVSIVLSREKFSKTIHQFPDQMPRIIKEVVSAVHTWERLFLEELGSGCEGCLTGLGVTLL
jgi:CRP/FNR family cyclic AMP-dependent transcriptional regulator